MFDLTALCEHTRFGRTTERCCWCPQKERDLDPKIGGTELHRLRLSQETADDRDDRRIKNRERASRIANCRRDKTGGEWRSHWQIRLCGWHCLASLLSKICSWKTRVSSDTQLESTQSDWYDLRLLKPYLDRPNKIRFGHQQWEIAHTFQNEILEQSKVELIVDTCLRKSSLAD